MGLIVVSGATGRLGGRVARLIGGGPRLLVRDAARAPEVAGATVAEAAYGDGAAVRRALAGADTVLMVSASETPDRVDLHRTFVDAAAAAGVRHLVYTSFFGAAADSVFTLARDHWATEEHIRRSGLAFTFLRDNLYADFLPFMAGEDGVIRGPAGDGRAALVAQDDIADAAVAVLREPAAHAGRTYDLTGPAAVSLAEAAATITEVTGRKVTYHAETVEEAYASRAKYDAPPGRSTPGSAPTRRSPPGRWPGSATPCPRSPVGPPPRWPRCWPVRPSRPPDSPRTSRAGWPARRRSSSSRGSAPRTGRCC